MAAQKSNVTRVRENGSERAVVFVHGYNGAQDDTWGNFPLLLAAAVSDFDIFTIGYATTLLPDVTGIWSADPDLPILAIMLSTELASEPFDRYGSLTLIAHSMGGLVVQKALVDDETLAARARNVILFGTPSAGLAKAGIFRFWKRQLRNMAAGSVFITALRDDWTRLFGAERPFNFLVVAGASDQFVPSDSSLKPFPRSFQKSVIGDHISIVKPADATAPSVALVVTTLKKGIVPAADSLEQTRLAAEQPTTKTEARTLAKAVEDTPGISWKDIVEAALALDCAGDRPASIALLDRYKEKDTDIKGALGGRYKRLWYDTGDRAHADYSLQLYREALASAQAANHGDQIYYLAINVAFMNFVLLDDAAAAQQMATLALQHATPPGDDVWKTATVAEAHLYFGRTAEALAEYRRLLTLQAEHWKHKSAALQASRIAAKLGRTDLIEQLDAIFTPASRQANRIFVSYSHADREWWKRLEDMLRPYLRDDKTELDVWVDTRIQPGQQWDAEIRKALDRSGVAVALVSKGFLASPYIMDHEFPPIISASTKGELELVWVYVESGGFEVTPLNDIQAAYDTKKPLSLLPHAEQEEALKSVAQQIKAAALRATERFKHQPKQP